MYESPIKVELSDIISDAVKKTDEYVLECVQKVGVSVNRDELLEALKFDREQYEKGWNDRDNEIVRCKDCKHYWKNKPSEDVPVCLASPREDAYCSEGERKEER